MRFNTVRYYISSATESIGKNSLMSIASIITVASCIFLFILSFSIATNIDFLLEQLESSIGFTVFIDDKVEDRTVDILINTIESLEHVDEVVFVSKKEAFDKMSQKFKSDIVAGFEEDNPFPRSLEIYLDNTKNQNIVVEQVQNIKNNIILSQDNSDSNNEELIKIKFRNTDALVQLNNIVRIISIIIIGTMAVISIVIIMNTIKLTVNNRRREINIMKYVGATDWFIRWPFVIEGIIIGALGAVIPVIIGWFLYKELLLMGKLEVPIISAIGNFRPVNEVFGFLIPISLLLGIFIGVIGSVSAMRKHLKV